MEFGKELIIEDAVKIKKQGSYIRPWSLVPATPSMACRSELAELRALARLKTLFTHAEDGLLTFKLFTSVIR